MSDKR